MKKFMSLSLLIILLVNISSCANKESDELESLKQQIESLQNALNEFETESTTENLTIQTPENTSIIESVAKGKETTNEMVSFDETEVIKQIEIKEQYQWQWNSIYYYLAFVVKNDSEFNISIDIKVIFKDVNGNMIGAKNQDESAFEKGSEFAFVFQNDTEFAGFDYEIIIKEDTCSESIISSLEKEINTTANKAVIAVKNNGDIPAQFVEYTVFFMNGDKVIDYGWSYLTDDDSEIKPGKTEYGESTCSKNFDSVKVYLTGRGEK